MATYGRSYVVETLPADLSADELRAYISRMGWYHEIDLGQGVLTAGAKPQAVIEHEWSLFALGDLSGRTVLDIGGVDGAYSFLAERSGSPRVAVLDHYLWATQPDDYWRIYRAHVDAGTTPPAPHESSAWDPEHLPAKWRFDTARQALGSRVDAIVLDFMACDLDQVGEWDVVFFLGILYHMEDPLRALRRLAAVTREQAIVETHAMVLDGHPEPLWQFHPDGELNHDRSNWWVPNMAALRGALTAAGFAHTEVLMDEPPEPLPQGYRAIVRGVK